MKKIELVGIIDDDAIFQHTTKRALQATEAVCEIVQFANGTEALKYFITHKNDPDKLPDLVFLDINMPSMNGWEFLSALAEESFLKKKISIYICSGSSDTPERAELISYPALRGYLTKPLRRESMFTLLDMQMSTR